MNTIPSTIFLYKETDTNPMTFVKSFDLLLDPSITYSDLRNSIELSDEVHLKKILVEDEEGDWITVTSDNELQEAYRFSSKEKSLSITAFCKSKPKRSSPESNPIVNVAPADPVVTVVPTPKDAVPSSSPIKTPKRVYFTPSKPDPLVNKSDPAPKPLPAVINSVITPTVINSKTPAVIPNRSKARHHAYCDSCQKNIFGIRFKCSICTDYDLCEQCEEKNLKEKFHPENHFFLKVNKPVRNALLSSHVAHIRPALMQKMQEEQQAASPQLEERVVSAESRLQCLEQKLRDLSVKPKCRKTLKKMILEEKPLQGPYEHRKKTNKSVPPPQVQQQQEQEQDQQIPSEIDDDTVPPLIESSLIRFGNCFEINAASQTLPAVSPSEELCKEPLVPTETCSVVAEPVPEIREMTPEQTPPQETPEQTVEESTEESAEEVVQEDGPVVKQLVAMGFDHSLSVDIVAVYPEIEDALEHILNVA